MASAVVGQCNIEGHLVRPAGKQPAVAVAEFAAESAAVVAPSDRVFEAYEV